MKQAFEEAVASSQQPPATDEPTPQQVYSACLSYRHDFGLLDNMEKQSIVIEAREWLHAWRKEFEMAPPTVPSYEMVRIPTTLTEAKAMLQLASMFLRESSQEVDPAVRQQNPKGTP